MLSESAAFRMSLDEGEAETCAAPKGRTAAATARLKRPDMVTARMAMRMRNMVD